MSLYYSVALAVENPEFFNRIAETFYSKTSIRFVILLWGEKSGLVADRIDGIPVFTYDEIINLGRESRRILSASHGASKLIGTIYMNSNVVLVCIASYFAENQTLKLPTLWEISELNLFYP